MKKTGIINAQLAGYLAGLGHTELFMICDAGMPIPKGIPYVDLALCGGVPTFNQVMDAILNETVVEYYTVANEMVEKNPRLLGYIRESLDGIDNDMIPQVEFMERKKQIKFAVRTGEFSPYGNVLLRAGVAFKA